MYFFSSKQDRSGIETVKPLCAILANLSVHFYVMLFIWLFIYVFLYISFFCFYWQIYTYLLRGRPKIHVVTQRTFSVRGGGGSSQVRKECDETDQFVKRWEK